jgi:hypothetical protein
VAEDDLSQADVALEANHRNRKRAKEQVLIIELLGQDFDDKKDSRSAGYSRFFFCTDVADDR